MNYENETCEGCVHYESSDAAWGCKNWKDGFREHCKAEDQYDACPGDRFECFTPSLECRKVRAWEKLASCVSHNEKDYLGMPIHTFHMVGNFKGYK